MGCTVVRPRDEGGNAPPRASAASDGRRGGGGGNSAQAASGGGDLTVPPKGWDDEIPAMSKSALEKKRAEFWDTRVEGKTELWQVLRGAAGADEATGKAMTASVGLGAYKCDASKKNAFCYDEFGFRYIVPLWVLFNPKSVTKGSSKRKSSAVPEKKSKELLEREAQDVTFAVRFSDGQPDLKLTTQGGTSIADLRQAIKGERNIPTEKQKIFYLGKQCRGHHNLAFYSIAADFVIHCFIQQDIPDPFKKK